MKVVVVEDEPRVRAFVVKALERRGYDVFDAADADAGLAVMADDDVAVLVTDIGLPRGRNGLEFAELVRATKPGTGLVVVSGDTDALAATARLGDGVVALPKPFRIVDLERAMCRAIANATGVEASPPRA